MMLTSPAFANGQAIPARYTCDGDDVSPPLEWHGVQFAKTSGATSSAQVGVFSCGAEATRIDAPNATEPAVRTKEPHISVKVTRHLPARKSVYLVD